MKDKKKYGFREPKGIKLKRVNIITNDFKELGHILKKIGGRYDIYLKLMYVGMFLLILSLIGHGMIYHVEGCFI